MRILIAGGAGFLGSHLCARCLAAGHEVACLDNLSTGRRENIAPLLDRPEFTFHEQDITSEPPLPDWRPALVYNLASPASPVDYLRLPLETLRVGSRGCENLLETARHAGAVFVQASTSEVYGDPLVHPQVETYWGNANPVGPRSVYDESKRFAEALVCAWRRHYRLETGIARIFNTYGPGLRPADGRVVSNFIRQALAGEPLTVYGDGRQTRSLCFVSDLVAGLEALAAWTARAPGAAALLPVNLGNPEETTILELAHRIISLCGSESRVIHRPLPVDDPVRRCPDITRAGTLLGWRPRIDAATGLARTIAWFRQEAEKR